MSKDLVTVATDGSCLTNPGFAGWAWYVSDNAWQSGAIEHGTNQVAELTGMLRALTDIPADLPLLLQSDSQYAIKCASVWLPGWKRNGWKTSAGAQVKNQDLIRGIDAALTVRRNAGGKVKFEWVRGHNGHLLNEAADLMCGTAAREARNGDPTGTVYGPGWVTTGGLAAPRYTQPENQAAEDLRLLDNW